MKIYLKHHFLTLTSIGLLLLSSCSDTWEEHYVNGPAGVLNDQTIASYIASEPSLSVFSQMLTLSGYDSILAKPQTYTVWAPVNQALTGINLNDTAMVRNLVMNHISRFSYPTSNLSNKVIYMLDRKFISDRKSTRLNSSH